MSQAPINVEKLRLAQVSVKDPAFGAKGDGVTDDRDALIAALHYIATVGGTLRVPAGTYLISASWTLTGGPASPKAFQIVGDGVENTVILRADGCGTMLNLRSAPDGVVVRDMTFNARADEFPTGANHTIVVGEASNVLVENIVVKAPWSAGVLILSSGPDIYNCLINNVRIYGGVENLPVYPGFSVGAFYAGTNVFHSGITNSAAYNGGKDNALSPGMGFELKYAGTGCYFDNLYVENCITGYGFATDGVNDNEKVRITNIHAKNCRTGLQGHLNNSVIQNVIIDMDDEAVLGLEPVQIRGDNNSYTGLVLVNQGNPVKYHVRLIAPARNNYVEVSEINNANGADGVASFEEGCTGNVVVVRETRSSERPTSPTPRSTPRLCTPSSPRLSAPETRTR